MKQNKVSIFLLLSILSRNNEYTNFFNIDLALERKKYIFTPRPDIYRPSASAVKGQGGGMKIRFLEEDMMAENN